MLAEVDQSQICSPTSPWPLNSGGAMNSGGAIEVAIEAALSALLVVLERRPESRCALQGNPCGGGQAPRSAGVRVCRAVRHPPERLWLLMKSRAAARVSHSRSERTRYDSKV